MSISAQPDSQHIAQTLAALGHTARIEIFQLLVRCGDAGMLVGEIGTRLKLTPSTLAHHLKAMVDAKLITQQRQGRQVVNRANFATINGAVAFLMAECCKGPPD
ncbi:metalloregulator ArsR/SmtB family transcription factor [Abyssibius alkaniclasticus]|uniref:ArsR/SmtB family transcription factor n=1 Tax=Abyssibius alkaniclasticus TaxID=2881234 RepID=UPI0023635957|nr:metalloregulator ArsR/SmtB family transcription factor [Abyssibius alkaniclasticus]UPH71532.1 metalloregulator ArsR/SmtB family transcription factor [Abyssibius alkaniclasticus]|tara:strand:+ start:984 stop:1295 length:312 start_codon:yes stop_codon:yes gene_type:complete